jgi:mono/diheme cytochrome c family protein
MSVMTERHPAGQRRQIIFRCLLACALVILLGPAAAMLSVRSSISAQSSASASAAHGSTSTNAPSATSRLEAAIDAGRIVFNQRCEICHFSDSAAQKIGPGLKGLFSRARFADGGKVSEASVAARIGKGGKDMPAYEGVLKTGQLQALIAYLKTR